MDDVTNLSNRDKQIICGLFFSKYDLSAVKTLGFESFAEAFNALGYGLGARPASIKNYRDELDPHFPNKRHGWHKRPLREHCKRILASYGDLGISQLEILIRGFLCPDEGLYLQPKIKRILQKYAGTAESSFAKRLITGKAAEEYFIANYTRMPEFSGHMLTDTTNWGCGFDFKMSPASDEMYSAVEVKGLRDRGGQVQFTSLEYEMAQAFAERYFLVLVRNFSERPFHSVYRDPLRSDLQFNRVEREEVRVSWVANVVH